MLGRRSFPTTPNQAGRYLNSAKTQPKAANNVKKTSTRAAGVVAEEAARHVRRRDQAGIAAPKHAVAVARDAVVDEVARPLRHHVGYTRPAPAGQLGQHTQ